MDTRTTFLLKATIFWVVAIIFWPLTPLQPAANHLSMFRITGDGQISISDETTGEHAFVKYRNEDGTYNEDALKTIDNLLRCHGANEVYPLSLKLIELVDHVEDNFGASGVTVTSGYRSPEYNRELKRKLRRVSTESLHMQGMAVDFKIASVGTNQLANYLRSLNAGGVGQYRRVNAIHADVGPVRHW